MVFNAQLDLHAYRFAVCADFDNLAKKEATYARVQLVQRIRQYYNIDFTTMSYLLSTLTDADIRESLLFAKRILHGTSSYDILSTTALSVGDVELVLETCKYNSEILLSVYYRTPQGDRLTKRYPLDITDNLDNLNMYFNGVLYTCYRQIHDVKTPLGPIDYSVLMKTKDKLREYLGTAYNTATQIPYFDVVVLPNNKEYRLVYPLLGQNKTPNRAKRELRVSRKDVTRALADPIGYVQQQFKELASCSQKPKRP